MTSMERKILIALKRYTYANIGFQELNGYLHFPPAEKIAMSIQSLQEAHYIEDHEFPNDSYSITASGIEQLKKTAFRNRYVFPALHSVWGYILCAVITAFVTNALT